MMSYKYLQSRLPNIEIKPEQDSLFQCEWCQWWSPGVRLLFLYEYLYLLRP